jgi:hypothetical protein
MQQQQQQVLGGAFENPRGCRVLKVSSGEAKSWASLDSGAGLGLCLRMHHDRCLTCYLKFCFLALVDGCRDCVSPEPVALFELDAAGEGSSCRANITSRSLKSPQRKLCLGRCIENTREFWMRETQVAQEKEYTASRRWAKMCVRAHKVTRS